MQDSLNDKISCSFYSSKLTLVMRNSVRSMKLDSVPSAIIDLVPVPVLDVDKGEVVEEDLADEPEDPLVAFEPEKHRRKRA